jgi:hypothetical protein
MKSIDIRSEAAVNLLAEFLDMDTGNNGGGERKNAEHFAHGEFLFCFNHNIYFWLDLSILWGMTMGALVSWTAPPKADKHLQPKPIAV